MNMRRTAVAVKALLMHETRIMIMVRPSSEMGIQTPLVISAATAVFHVEELDLSLRPVMVHLLFSPPADE
jgi:hypothetical protein